MSQQLKPPFGTLNITDEASYESVTLDIRNVATNISDSTSTE